MLNLKDGTLWQWDTGRKLIVTLDKGHTIDKVQFYNGVGNSALPGVISTDEDGTIYASIPNSLLQHPNNLTAYLMTTDEDGVKTTQQITLAVNLRAKPEDYIFTDDEILTYKEHDGRLKNLEMNALAFSIGTQMPEFTSPTKGLWFDTSGITDDDVILVLSEELDDAEVQADVGKDSYGVENATVNKEATQSTYNFDIV